MGLTFVDIFSLKRIFGVGRSEISKSHRVQIDDFSFITWQSNYQLLNLTNQRVMIKYLIHLQPTSNSTKTFTLSEMVIGSFSNRSVAVKRSSKKRSRANEDFELELTGLKCVSG